MEKKIITHVDNEIAIILVNNEKKMNCLDVEIMISLKKELIALKKDIKIKGIIISGSGDKAFVSGADINLFPKMDFATSYKFSKQGNELLNIIDNFPKPVIAAINGFALGGGCELAMACHYRIATKKSMFGQPEIKLGIIPGFGGTQRLPLLVGKSNALNLMLSGDFINADEALRIGLIDKISSNRDIISESLKTMQELLKNYDPELVSRILRLTNSAINNGKDFKLESNEFRKSFKKRVSTKFLRSFLKKP